MFDPSSRYANAGTYVVTLADGTPVTLTRIPPPLGPSTLGWHRRAQSERLDLLAWHYLHDATAAWKLGWTNGAMSLDALASHDSVAIPRDD
jgi:hypothetical protein